MLAIVTDAWGAGGGIARYNRDFLGAIAAAAQVDVLPRHANDAVGALPPGVAQAPSRPGRWRYAIAATIEALRRRPQVVFCGHLYMAPLAALMSRLLRARLVVQTHGIEAWPRPSRSIRWATEQADLVLAVSRYTRARVLSWAAIEPERVAVLPNTVSACFTPGDRSAARRRFSLGDQRVLLTVGRISGKERYKGQDRVIEAIPALLAAGHDVLYLVAGDGDDLPRLQRLAIATGVSERVRFLGAVPDGDLPDLYRAADLVVMPSTGEGFGITYLESMACGTPALGLAIRGDRDALAPILRLLHSLATSAEPAREAVADAGAANTAASAVPNSIDDARKASAMDSRILQADETLRSDPEAFDWLGQADSVLRVRAQANFRGQVVADVERRFGRAVFERRAAALFTRVLRDRWLQPGKSSAPA